LGERQQLKAIRQRQRVAAHAQTKRDRVTNALDGFVWFWLGD
jgi:hypothetical protein